ncbi:MAG TPA: lamin tail domain-containing protein [Bacilli bacterium]|nr:lamin tail domain-containing protein [Bacilli bacterium]
MLNQKNRNLTALLLSGALVAALTVGLLPSGHSAAATPNHPLLSEVYADTNVSYEPEEYVAVTNPTSSALDVSGWTLRLNGKDVSFPAATTIVPKQTLYVTKTATTFEQELQQTPQFEYGSDSDRNVPQMVVAGAVPTLSNAGAQVLLLDANGQTVDAMVYGNEVAPSGWTGAAVPTVSEGTMLVRERDEVTGVLPDSDSAQDWNHLRVYQAGQSRFGAPTFSFAGTVQPYSSPDNSFATVVALLNSATTSIDLNVYEFQSMQLLEPIKDALARGVHVRIFLEGQPVGGLVDQGKYVAQQIIGAGGEVRFIVSDTDNGIYKRYRFDHAKYAIIDGNRALVQSENWKSTGVPADNSYGNRGWGIILNDRDTAQFYLKVFNSDWNTAAKDSFPYTASDSRWGAPSAGFAPDATIGTGGYVGNFKSQEVNGEFNVTPIFAPDSTFLHENSIMGLAKQVQHELLVEQLYIHKHWGSPSAGDTVDTAPNLYLEEVINAARRGVKVRVVLDSAFLHPEDPRDNQYTVQYINDIAAREGLDMQAKLVDLSATHYEKIHNKGMIADGHKVLVSSINWSKNSPENNREAGVIVDNTEVAAYYQSLFWYDWTGGAQSWNPEQPKGNAPVVINEVMYRTGGYDSSREYVELYNPNNVSVDLTGYKLSNKSGNFTIPSDTVVPAHSFLMVGKDSAQFAAYKGFGLDVSGMKLTLTNTGDDLQLKNASGATIDEVAWNNYVNGWSLATPSGQVLSRKAVGADTDTVNDWTITQPNPKK